MPAGAINKNRLPSIVTSTTNGAATTTTDVVRVNQPLTKVRATAKDMADPVAMVRIVDELQHQTEHATRAVRALPFADGSLFKGLKFSANINLVIKHGFNRPYEGWWPTRVLTNAHGLKEVANNSNAQVSASLDNVQLTLVSSTPCTCDIWVF